MRKFLFESFETGFRIESFNLIVTLQKFSNFVRRKKNPKKENPYEDSEFISRVRRKNSLNAIKKPRQDWLGIRWHSKIFDIIQRPAIDAVLGHKPARLGLASKFRPRCFFGKTDLINGRGRDELRTATNTGLLSSHLLVLSKLILFNWRCLLQLACRSSCEPESEVGKHRGSGQVIRSHRKPVIRCESSWMTHPV